MTTTSPGPAPLRPTARDILAQALEDLGLARIAAGELDDANAISGLADVARAGAICAASEMEIAERERWQESAEHSERVQAAAETARALRAILPALDEDGGTAPRTIPGSDTASQHANKVREQLRLAHELITQVGNL